MQSDSHDRQIEGIDKAGLTLALASLATLVVVQRRHGSSIIGSTISDLAAPEALPLLTRLTMSNFPIGVALFGLLTLGAAFAQRSAKVRRFLMLVVLAVVVLSAALPVLGSYLLIFQLADRIKAD